MSEASSNSGRSTPEYRTKDQSDIEKSDESVAALTTSTNDMSTVPSEDVEYEDEAQLHEISLGKTDQGIQQTMQVTEKDDGQDSQYSYDVDRSAVIPISSSNNDKSSQPSISPETSSNSATIAHAQAAYRAAAEARKEHHQGSGSKTSEHHIAQTVTMPEPAISVHHSTIDYLTFQSVNRFNRFFLLNLFILHTMSKLSHRLNEV